MNEMLTFESWDDNLVQQIINELHDATDVIKWAYEEYGDDILYACSFGAEGIVLIDIISKINPEAKIAFLDTDLHFQETYNLIEQIEKKYPSLQINKIKSNITLHEQSKFYGDELWKYNPDLCCHLRKVIPLKEELKKVKAWLSGLRREQSETRRNINFINKDEKFRSIKVCPLTHWSWKDIWNYIITNQLPYNPLHDQNYPSIGCETCTMPAKNETDSRAGRWANSVKTECGLHKGP